MRPVEVRRHHSSHVDQALGGIGARWYIRFQREGWLAVERFLWICLAGAAGTGVRYLIALWSTQRFGTCLLYTSDAADEL